MTTPALTQRLWTAGDAADWLNVSTETVRRRIADGTIRAIKLGRLVRIDPAALRAITDEDRFNVVEHEARMLGARDVSMPPGPFPPPPECI
jgi:excisionase family DNA binding protein